MQADAWVAQTITEFHIDVSIALAMGVERMLGHWPEFHI